MKNDFTDFLYEIGVEGLYVREQIYIEAKKYFGKLYGGQQLSMFPIEKKFENATFDGSDIVPEKDNERLTKQIEKVYNLMKDGQYRTLAEITFQTGAPAASVSAQLRNLRKVRFGSHLVTKRPRGNRKTGLFEYKLTVNKQNE